jgi:hypothetical protein
MNEDNERLLRSLDSASNALKRQTGGKAGEGTEKVYAQAYQECVKAGIKPKLRKKYR